MKYLFSFHTALRLIIFSMSLSIISCEADETTTKDETVATTKETSTPELLPLSLIPMNDLSQFQSPDAAWQVVGNVLADLDKPQTLTTEAGTGIIAMTENTSTTLRTNVEHGDLELSLEFLLSKNSEARLLLQGQYGITLQDSWNDASINANTCGTIGKNLPAFNACMAPGLWQTLKVLFRAPTLDEQGNEIDAAKIEYVYLNDMLIQSEIELVSSNKNTPNNLVLQAEKPVAFRNLKIKKFGNQRVALDNIRYKMYEGSWDYIPNFDTLTMAAEGSIDTITKLQDIAGLEDRFGLVFEGDLNIPVAGKYLFETQIDDGGDLYIDNQLVVHNEGEPGFGTERALIDLTAGQHTFKLTYYQEVWSSWITIWVEGPEIEKQPLASLALGSDDETVADIIEITPDDAPEMVRAFINYADEKRTHTIAVGNPEGIHFAYDLREGALLNAWKGRFADVTEMWRGRGESQLLKPLNAIMEATAGVPIAQLPNEKAVWSDELPKDFRALGYSINNAGRPIFEYQIGEIKWLDAIEPNGNKLRRTVSWSDDEDNYYFRIAEARSIQQLENGLYSIDGAYYVSYSNKVNEKPTIRNSENGQLLIVPMKGNTAVEYELIW